MPFLQFSIISIIIHYFIVSNTFDLAIVFQLDALFFLVVDMAIQRSAQHCKLSFMPEFVQPLDVPFLPFQLGSDRFDSSVREMGCNISRMF